MKPDRLILLAALLLPAALPGAESPRFNRDIRPIFSKTCFACHGPDARARKGDLRLDRREDAVADRDGTRAIVPGNAEASEVMRRMTASDPDKRMPPPDFHTQLTEAEIDTVRRWINQGAVYEAHWAFIPPRRPDGPAGPQAIDFFVRRKLEAEGLQPAPRADRRALIRRVALDLTGLPPTPTEVRAFLEDPADDEAAYARVVDRLLASPRYAEHRARYWMDTARYADTSGYQYDRIRHQWAWRDWVIHAFDSNMPFDRFTIEQNAGDLLPDATPQTRLATGFHRNHPITIEGGVIDEEYRTEYVMDRVVTTSTAWLGLTMICARCHDHKYDPLTQDDFYSLFAFFNNVPERGLSGFNPRQRIESPLRPTGLARLENETAEAEKRLRAARKKFAASFADWEARLRAEIAARTRPIQLDRMSAEGGTVLKAQQDGSVLATGPNPARQTYRVEFTVADEPLRAIRLEALTHPSHANKSTGRGSNGNFVLSEVRVEVAGKDGKFSEVKIQSAQADYEQKGYPVSAVIDGQLGRKGWAVDGNTRAEDRHADFTLARAIEPGARVRFSMIHTWGGSHSIGRFRLSIPQGGKPVPKDIRKALATEPKKRDAKAREALKNFLALRYGDDEYRALHREVAAIRARRDKARAATPETMILTEMDKPRETFVLQRGEYDKPIKDRRVSPGIPAVFGALPEGEPASRLGFARWLVSRDNPLTARVIVNRFWAQLFGTGLVKTIEDFGSQGEYPSHPDLLDWLAVEFMESGWDVKHLFRTIVTSQTYCQSSRVTPEAFSRDPENRLLARGPRHRLDAEAIRDSALAVSGLLEARLGGPSAYPYHPKGLWLEINNRPRYSRAYPHSTDPDDLYRRSLYTFWKRTVPPPSMAAFDAPEREFCTVRRSRTNTPLQAFVLLHDPQFVEAARKLGERLLTEAGEDPRDRLTYAFELCLARPPNAVELRRLEAALNSRLAYFKSHPEAVDKLLSVGVAPVPEKLDRAELAAWTTVARIVLNLSEFITKG